jgi:cell division protein FtsB
LDNDLYLKKVDEVNKKIEQLEKELKALKKERLELMSHFED